MKYVVAVDRCCTTDQLLSREDDLPLLLLCCTRSHPRFRNFISIDPVHVARVKEGRKKAINTQI